MKSCINRSVRRDKAKRIYDSHPQRQAVHRKKLNDNEWQLTSVSNPREKLTLNRWQMHVAGLLKQVEVKV
ncbi:hypothetical protein [Enterobacter hormaechei]|uniref:hypothetical protein n=1 Tax=Enterobacter hormaechei TaxID=158836 RepID=UPI0015D4BCDF|nr:hypothetical protein [Enterobacter hormaechei]